MSRLLKLLNNLKTQANVAWLTDAQRDAFASLEQELRFPEKINLYGPGGCGKTFLAWAVSRALSIPYYPSPQAFEARSQRPQPQAIVDNVSVGERAARQLLAISQSKGTHTLVFITHQPNSLRMYAIGLPPPSPADFDVVYRNLSLLEYYALPPVRHGDLWQAVHAVL